MEIPENKIVELLPASMLNAYVYCPRLFWLEHVEREFQSTFEMVDGERVHRRVDQSHGELPASAERVKAEASSVELASAELGVVAKIDLVRADGERAVPIEYKRGKVPPIEGRAYDPERVQVCLQALLLRENGYTCDTGRIYYASSNRFVDIPIDDDLIALARSALSEARALMERGSIPPPLDQSPKCGGCSLNAICLPDETNALQSDARRSSEIRPFAAPLDDRVWLYVLEAGSRVGLSGETLQVRDDEGVKAEMPLFEAAGISLFGNVQISSQAMRAVLGRDVPVFFLSYGGWLTGYARSVNDHSLDLRQAQHRVAGDADASLRIARAMVFGKIRNQRTMVRRSLGSSARPALQALSLFSHRAQTATDVELLLGFEGSAARVYFEAFAQMLRIQTGFEVTGRTRRPPTDPVNALLSFGYAMLAKEALAAAVAVGFEPGLGLYHKVRAGRPSLALDLMEEFRPLVVDSTVLSLVNAREIQASHFDRRGKAIVLTQEGRKIFIGAIERRLRSSVTHPAFGYTLTYRRALHVQARLLARTIQGDIPAYPPFMTR
ncbi:MAG: CRISPR-associated endonuclease Cas4g/Cas1g [Candidatus Baltobacteraceae bacterium]